MELTIKDVSVFYDGVDHSEGVCVHPDGSVWSGGEAGQVYRIAADGSAKEEIANTGGFNLGLAFSPGAKWLAICDNGKKCIWKLDVETRKLEKFADGAGTEKIKIPNYAVFDSRGNLYVSDSGGFRDCSGRIFKFDTEGNGVIWQHGPFNFANGLALNKAEDQLYVVSSFLPGVETISIQADGSAGERKVFVTMPQTVPDGLAFDENGNLFITCYTPNAIYMAKPNQEIRLVVDDWEAHTLSNPTNIAFGGENFDQLFAANLGRWHISKVNLGIKGQKLVSHY